MNILNQNSICTDYWTSCLRLQLPTRFWGYFCCA